MISGAQGRTGFLALASVIVLGCAVASATCAWATSAAAKGQLQCEEPASKPRQVHFVPNSYRFWSSPKHATTELPEGCTGSDCTPVPAYANIVLQGSNFLPCQGGPFALCYYSGPSTTSESLGCTLTEDGRFANCNCYAIPYGAYLVDINAILNNGVYRKTIKKCGTDGSQCGAVNAAPVCRAINQRRLIPGAASISAFSLDCVPTDGLGQTNCTTAAPYAGCMTAPCTRTGDPEIVQCSCPVYDGPYQIGQDDQECTPPDGEVWSAAYAPDGQPLPAPASCLPDAPGASGCPLYVPGTTALPAGSGVNCQTVCLEYQQCKQGKGIQVGYTCDATLCTSECNDRDLVSGACTGLSSCGVTEIIKAEQAAECSCCASQLCGCEPNGPTNAAIYDLNQQQRDRGIAPQCDVNGTLCGAQPSGG